MMDQSLLPYPLQLAQLFIGGERTHGNVAVHELRKNRGLSRTDYRDPGPTRLNVVDTTLKVIEKGGTSAERWACVTHRLEDVGVKEVTRHFRKTEWAIFRAHALASKARRHHATGGRFIQLSHRTRHVNTHRIRR